MSSPRQLLKPLVALITVGLIGFFFVKAFQRSWSTIREHHFVVSPVFLVASGVALIATTLLGTAGWYTAMNGLSPNRISFRQSVAINNASSLTKYVPGKLWSFALQMYWLDGIGISKALTVYVNLINLLISMAMTVMLGLACLVVSSTRSFPMSVLVGSFVGLLVLDMLSIWFNHAILNGFIVLLNRVLKRNIRTFEVRKSLLIRMHVVHLLSAAVSGLGVYLFCLAIGYRIDFGRTMVVIGASLISDVIGFLAVIVPGGLGVREALMYAILGGSATGSLSLILPVGSRLLSMAMDVVLGAFAVRLLSTLPRDKNVET